MAFGFQGPDIDPSEILGPGFGRSESSAVRDVNSTEDLNKAWFTTAKDKEALIDKGINWKQGAWSQEVLSFLRSSLFTLGIGCISREELAPESVVPGSIVPESVAGLNP